MRSTRPLALSLACLLALTTLACRREPITAEGGSAPSPAAAAGSGGREALRIVGSSTVYPFSTAVAERFGRETGFKTPVIESTGTGGGFKLFCAGVGVQHPDLTNASRAIKPSEIEQCRAHGVQEITEVPIGYDGIVVANDAAAPRYHLTREQLFRALAKQVPAGEGQVRPNPYERWSQIDPALPDREIEVYGPPPTSGTRDAFVELVMEEGCQEIPWIRALRATDEERFQQICHAVREDGAYIEAGENDNLIVQKLDANPAALGIFGYSFLDQNRDRLQGSVIEGVEPTFENIAGQRYPVSRPLFFYVKKAHAGVIPGIREYVAEFVGAEATGPDGYLTQMGLIPLPEARLAEVRHEATTLASNVGVE